jgi:hypothetical protein
MSEFMKEERAARQERVRLRKAQHEEERAKLQEEIHRKDVAYLASVEPLRIHIDALLAELGAQGCVWLFEQLCNARQAEVWRSVQSNG